MSFEAALKTHLQDDATINGIVSERIHPVMVPERSPVPAITYTVIYGEPQNAVDGFTGALTRYTVQIDCWAETFATARRLAEAVRDRMNEAAASFRSVVREYPALDDYEADTKRYRRSVGVSCWHSEA